jgi:hypothetical protein
MPDRAGHNRYVAARLLLAFALLASSGCASTRTWLVASRPCIDPELQAKRGVQVVAYTTADGVRHPYRGRVRAGPEGRLHFFQSVGERPRAIEVPLESGEGTPFTLDREQVTELVYRRDQDGLPYFLAGVGTGFGLTILATFIFFSIVFSDWE